MLDIQTNNFVESWYSVLKGTYLKGVRKQRTDFLVQKLLDEVLPDMRKKVALVLSGFTTRPLKLTEKNQQDKFLFQKANYDIKSYIQQLDPRYDGSVEEISVRSFSQEDTYYIVSCQSSDLHVTRRREAIGRKRGNGRSEDRKGEAEIERLMCKVEGINN